MSKADIQFKTVLEDIINNGYNNNGTETRTKYADGTPAYTSSIFGVQMRYNNGEVPILTCKKVFSKTAILEMLLFWVRQTVKKEDFDNAKVSIWNEWFKEDGTLGKSYAYQFESRPKDEFVKLEVKAKEKHGELSVIKEDRFVANVGYIGNLEGIKNFTDEELQTLRFIWIDMINKCYDEKYSAYQDYGKHGIFVDEHWHCFANFLNDVRYVPQFFIARQENLEGWVLDPIYFASNCFSLDTVAWITQQDYEIYSENTTAYFRFKLSKNQVVELLRNIKNNPSSRRLMTSFWNFNDVEDKALQECAFQTQWKVRDNKLDLILTQRSADYCVGVPFNVFQYYILQNMVALQTGYEVGEFIHHIGDCHIYDRHIDGAKQLLDNPVHKSPKLWINNEVTDFFNYTVEDFALIGYESESHIPFEIAI